MRNMGDTQIIVYSLDKRPAPHVNRPAYFSTKFGQRPARSKFEDMPVQIRSNYMEACTELTGHLRSHQTEACMALKREDIAPVDCVLHYFDEYDITFYQPGFLCDVLRLIVQQNEFGKSLRESEVTAFVSCWMNINENAFNMFDASHQAKDLFLEEEFEEHGAEFLHDCFWRIAQIKENLGLWNRSPCLNS